MFDYSTLTWKSSEITRLLGPQALTTIASIPALAPLSPGIPDRLLWLPARSGLFTVKNAYRHLSAPSATAIQPNYVTVWKKIASSNNLIPKIRLFIWRLCKNALLTSRALHRKIHAIDAQCPRCGYSEEDAAHLFFFCPLSRGIWFASSLGLRTDSLPHDPFLVISLLLPALLVEDWVMFANTLWAIWKSRNDCVFRGKAATPQGVIASASILTNCHQPVSSHRLSRPSTGTDLMNNVVNADLDLHGFHCLCDGAWKEGQGGIGFMFCQGSTLIEYHASAAYGESALAMEAEALLQAMNKHLAVHSDKGKCTFLTDCLELANTINAPLPQLYPSVWTAAQVLWNCWNVASRWSALISVRYSSREGIWQAHNLATRARQDQSTYHGYTYPLFTPGTFSLN